jgi:hypothetical protein
LARRMPGERIGSSGSLLTALNAVSAAELRGLSRPDLRVLVFVLVKALGADRLMACRGGASLLGDSRRDARGAHFSP